MKQKTPITIFAYDVGTEVYAISVWYNHNEPTDHLAIYKAKVISWSYDAEENEILYYLESRAGKWWGDSIKSGHISTDFDELIQIAKKIWKDGE